MYSIFMRKWVHVLFQVNSKCDKILYMKKGTFFAFRSIYIWNLLLESFPMIGRMIGKLHYNEGYIFLFFGEKTAEMVIYQEPKLEKNLKKRFFEATFNKESVGIDWKM